MLNMRWSSVIFLILLMVFPALCRAETADLKVLLNELKIASAQTRTLSSRFVQEKHLAIFSEKLLSQGRFVFQGPDSLRWELLTPVATGFVLRGSRGERWNSLNRELERFSVKDNPIMGVVAQQLLAWARVDLDWLEQRYHMELITLHPARLRLTPLDPGEAGFIDYLQILFADNRRHVDEVLLMEKGGDSTLLRFTDVQLNIELPEAIFSPPEFR